VSKSKLKKVLAGVGAFASLGFCQAPHAFVNGRVEPVDGDANLYVEFREMGNGTVVQRETVAVDGSFHLRDLASGTYEVRVVSGLHNDTLWQEFVDVNPLSGPLVLRLPKTQQPQARPVSGVVSVRELQTHVPKKAFQAFVKAQHYAESAKPEEAIVQLRRAIELDPNWRDAHVNLGAELVRAGRYPEALSELEAAIRIGPPSAVVYTNYGAALATVRRLPEAEKAVREALRLDPSCWRAHYLLGHILASQSGRDEEALDQLRSGAVAAPAGHLIAAQVLLREGDRAGAAAEVRAYLKSGERTYKARAQQSLAELER
jgi:tetratricopeptide (TPR) repeat protein